MIQQMAAKLRIKYSCFSKTSAASLKQTRVLKFQVQLVFSSLALFNFCFEFVCLDFQFFHAESLLLLEQTKNILPW